MGFICIIITNSNPTYETFFYYIIMMCIAHLTTYKTPFHMRKFLQLSNFDDVVDGSAKALNVLYICKQLYVADN